MNIVDQTAQDLARARGRANCALGAALWVALFAWVWIGAAPLARWLGGAWFLLGAATPLGFIYSLALAFPWFGNNPGGPHLLYLLEMGLMGLVAGHLLGRARGAVEPRPGRLDLWVWLFTFLSLASLLPGWPWHRAELEYNPRGFAAAMLDRDGTTMSFGVEAAIKLALAVGLYVVLRDRPWPPARLRRVWWVLLGALAFTALVGWLNYAGWLPLGWWRGENYFIEARFGWTRLQSLYWHSGWLAQYIEALAPGALALGLAARGRTKAVLLGLAALLAVTQVFTMARAGWIGLAGGCAMVLAAGTLADAAPRRLRRLGLRLAALGLIIVLAGAALALLSHDFRHRAGELFAYQHRTGIWKLALEAGWLSPWTGLGLGNYGYVMHLFNPNADATWKADNITAHSLYLNILAERGLIGLALFLCMFGLVVRGLLASLRSGTGETPVPQEEAETRAIKLAVLGGLTALALDGLFQYIFYVRTIEILFWLLLGWGAALAAPALPAGGVRSWRAARWAMVGIVVLTLWAHRYSILPELPEVRGADGVMQTFLVAEKRATLPLPEGARRVRIKLASTAPDAEKNPPMESISLGTKLLQEVQFHHDQEVIIVDVDLPERRPMETPLVIESSRSWSLMDYGWRYWPYARIGVMYQLPQKLE